MSNIEEKQKIEIAFWRDSKDESPQSDSIHNIINKVSDAGVFLDCVKRHQKKLAITGKILELGAGQGWASCVYKRLFPKNNWGQSKIKLTNPCSRPPIVGS